MSLCVPLQVRLEKRRLNHRFFRPLVHLSFWVAGNFATDNATPDVAVLLDHRRSRLGWSHLDKVVIGDNCYGDDDYCKITYCDACQRGCCGG